jgi:hypothetical protein
MPQALPPELDLLQLGPQTLGSRLTLDRKRPVSRLRAWMREAEEGERFGLAQPPLGATCGREAAPFEPTGFLGMQGQAELGEALPEFLEAAFGIVSMLEPHDEITRVADDDDVAASTVRSPVLSPPIQDLVELHVRQER